MILKIVQFWKIWMRLTVYGQLLIRLRCADGHTFLAIRWVAATIQWVRDIFHWVETFYRWFEEIFQ